MGSRAPPKLATHQHVHPQVVAEEPPALDGEIQQTHPKIRLRDGRAKPRPVTDAYHHPTSLSN